MAPRAPISRSGDDVSQLQQRQELHEQSGGVEYVYKLQLMGVWNAVREGEQQALNFDLAHDALGALDRAGHDVSTRTGAIDSAVPPGVRIIHHSVVSHTGL